MNAPCEPRPRARISVGDVVGQPVTSGGAESLREQQAKQAGLTALEAPGRSGAAQDDVPEAGEPHSPTRRKVAWLTASVAAATLMCSAMTAMSLVLATASGSADDTRVARQITGADALLPGLVQRAGRSSTAQERSPRRDTVAAPVDRQKAGTDLLGANPSAGSAQSAIELVREFYYLLDHDPNRALTLVSPDVLDQRGTEIARSWAAMQAVRTRHVRATGENTVVASVTATTPGGSRVVLHHSFTVRAGSQPRITATRLRGAAVSVTPNP